MLQTHYQKDTPTLGIGYYTVPEAARLLKIRPLNIRRWLGGYSYTHGDKTIDMPPLWTPQLPAYDHHIELGFRDLIELRVIKSFLDAGLSILTVRNCLEYARECAGDDHPFSTRRFRTDGRTIFLESMRRTGEDEVLDLKSHQYAIKKVIDRTFKDLDISHDIVTRWRPFEGRQSIVIDPKRAFGQPIATNYGVPTVVLADAVKAEGSITRVSRLYDVSPSAVRDAVKFEQSLAA
ncbi:hypothetical protein XH98_28965 [Bradyrhizobium sp. CCBAU 51745]|uniref:hypothetical protein n=1 Tax=Bradyrhizobium sp. CCBAU 51745 TaxID=1325099 RepID=UPI002305079D|nr:hypothetical protein [Bradyrhizobium sp. CCBAU 51745]MDA9443059.1 hypothetical protein [Bradyrhizobium sp. CCBAU 51745]